jgi:hypothetical protein
MTGLNDARRYAAAVSLGSRGRATPEQAFDALAADVSGEGMHFIATVIVMTARNGTETTFEDRTKLNKARAKRGESPLNDHVVVHMRLSRAERNASPRIDAAAVGSRASPRFHAVVGHPVVRASQIFWRRAHARGYSSGRPAAITRTVQVSL